MTQNGGGIIDLLGNNFPLDPTKLSSLDQALSDLLGAAFHESGSEEVT